MRIHASADDLSLSIATLENLDPATMEPAKAYKSEDIKKVDGKIVYRLQNIYVKDGDYKANVSVSIFNKPTAPIPALTPIKLVGKAEITPFLLNGRISYSLVADGVEVVK